jgi:hypothetical protein
MNPLQWAFVLGVCTLVVAAPWCLVSCAVPLPPVEGAELALRAPYETAALGAVAREWAAAGYRPCDTRGATVRYPRWLRFTQDCYRPPCSDPRGVSPCSNGCNSDGEIVVDRGSPTPGRVIVHEAAHWCSAKALGDPDVGHRNAHVFEDKRRPAASVEGRAKAAVGVR